MPMRRPVFVAATRQHTGKTTVSLALMSGLKRRFEQVGFIKPVGQQHIAVRDETGRNIRIDKDCEVLKEYFDLQHVTYQNMSPVIIPKGYTAKYIDGEITMQEQLDKINRAITRVGSDSDFVLLEGTGHTGVGSIVGLSNAKVAALCGADCVLVANGGLGSAFDELELNKLMFDAEGVRCRGVILNKCVPEKVEKVRDYFGRLLQERWGVPLLGVVPDLPFLGKSNLGEIERKLGGEMLAGTRCRSLHYGTKDAFLITTGLRRFLRRAFQSRSTTWRRPLFVTHVTRDDLVLGFLAHHQRKMTEQRGAIHGPDDWAGAMILSFGASQAFPDQNVSEDERTILPYIREMIEETDAPIIMTDLGTIDVLEQVKSFTAKQNVNDMFRVKAAIDHYEPHIDFDTLLAG